MSVLDTDMPTERSVWRLDLNCHKPRIAEVRQATWNRHSWQPSEEALCWRPFEDLWLWSCEMGSSCPNHSGWGPSALPLHTNTESLSCCGAQFHTQRWAAVVAPEHWPLLQEHRDLGSGERLIEVTCNPGGCCWAQLPIFVLVIRHHTSNSKHWLWKEGSVMYSLKCNAEMDHLL